MIRDRAILLGWIAGLLIAITLIWIVAKPVHARYLMITVNRVFINSGDNRRLSSFIDRPGEKSAGNTGASRTTQVPWIGRGSGLLGYWYTMSNTQDLMFVFAVFQDGILVPCGAIVSADGKVNEIIPLSAHAERVYNKIPQSVLRIYIQRIETAPRPDGSKVTGGNLG
jgi:hypothetical protein